MADITISGTIIHDPGYPYKVELTRGQKGVYGWTITTYAESVSIIVEYTRSLDNELRKLYGEPPHGDS